MVMFESVNSAMDKKISRQEYEPRPGSINLGWEYENLVPALFALRAICRSDIVDMWLATNANGMGAFDDVILYLQFENGEKVAYVIQLKHKKESITAARFTKESDDYSIKKYQHSFEEIMNNYEIGILKSVPKENIHFIIYTIADFSDTIDKRKMQKLNLALEPGKDEEGELINTSMNNDFIYKFKIGNESELFYYNESFLTRFCFFVKQGHTHFVEHLIKELICERFGNCNSDITISFLNFIKMWARGSLGKHYKLRKSDIQLKLSELLLFPYVKEPRHFCKFKNADVWNEFVSSSKLVVADNYTEGMLVKIWSAINSILYAYTDQKFRENVSWTKSINYKNLPRKYKKDFSVNTVREIGKTMEITAKCLYTILWKEGLVPLVIIADDLREVDNILMALSLCNHAGSNRNAILLIKGKNEKTIDSATQTLEDIIDVNLRNKLLDNLYVSLQAREPLPLSQIIPADHGIMKEITIELILEMLQQPLTLGEANRLPRNYIKRTVCKVILKKDVLQLKHQGFVINGAGDIFEELINYTDEWRVIDGNYFKYSKEKASKANVVALEEGSTLDEREYKHFSSNKTAVHYLSYRKGQLEWLNSKGSIKELRPFLITDSKFCINEDDILKYFPRNTNILTGQPGMGKTVMIKRLAATLMQDYWVVTIFLNKLYGYFKKITKPTIDDFSIEHFTIHSNFSNALVSLLKENKKVVYLLDAFDEISECSELVIRFAKSIENQGHRLWITTRPVHKRYLEKRMNVFSISINPITPVAQKNYLQNHLKNLHSAHDVVSKLHNEMSKSFYSWDLGFLSLPLHLRMVAEMIDDDDSNDQLLNSSTPDLYESFINKKLNVYWKKMFGDYENLPNRRIYDKEMELLKIQHSKAALFVFYSKDDLVDVFDYEEIEIFLKNVKTGNENIGIIFSVSEKPLFIHRTLSEYLAAQFLANNLKDEKVKPLLVRLFDRELTGVRQLFDRFLAKDRPLHLAVLDSNIAEVANLLNDNLENLNQRDLGGRTALHIAAAWGLRHHSSQTIEDPSKITIPFIRDHWADAKKCEILIRILSESKNSNVKDEVLGWRPIDYAVGFLAVK